MNYSVKDIVIKHKPDNQYAAKAKSLPSAHQTRGSTTTI